MEGIVERLDPPVGPFKGAIVLRDDGGQAFLTRDEAKQSGLLNVQPGQRLGFTLQQNPKHALPNVVKPQLIVSVPAVVPVQGSPVKAVKFVLDCPIDPDENNWFHLTVECQDAQGLPAYGVVRMSCARVFQIKPFTQPNAQASEVNNHSIGMTGEGRYFLAIPPGLSAINFVLEGVSSSKQQLKIYQMAKKEK